MSDLFLYVEDDDASRRMMTFLMTRVMKLPNFVVFENSENFMERVRALPEIPRAIFLDVRVHPHNGYEMLKMLKQDSHYQDVKVVAITATIMPTDVAHFREEGFDGLIGKPIRQAMFPDLLHRILRGESVWYVT